MTTEIEVLGSPGEVAERAADLFVDAVGSAQQRNGIAHVVLTGGSTGIAVLRAIRDRADQVDWSTVHVWWGDERFVPHDSDERNDLQADEALLRHVALPADHVHRVAASDGPFGDDPDAAADAYAAELANFASDGTTGPVFDVLMLGVGEEGHTASIFPHSPAATDHRPVCAVRDCPKPPPTRVTMTTGLLSSADEVWLMTTGAAKADAVAQAVAGADPIDIPAAGPHGHSLTRWLLDEAAASRIPQ